MAWMTGPNGRNRQRTAIHAAIYISARYLLCVCVFYRVRYISTYIFFEIFFVACHDFACARIRM